MVTTSELLMVRHTQTAAAGGLCVGGGSDVALAPEFESTWPAILARLPSKIDHHWTSPLRRCRLLAERLAPLGKWEVDARLQEIHFGAWEGQAWDALAGPELDEWMADFVHVAPPRGEHAVAFQQRVAPVLEELKEQGGTTLVVAHAGTIRMLVATALGRPLQDLFLLDVPHGGLVRLVWNECGWTLFV